MGRSMPKKKEWRRIFFVAEDDLEFTKRKMMMKGWTFHSAIRKHGWKYTMKFWRWMHG
jgi:hypothetical protein